MRPKKYIKNIKKVLVDVPWSTAHLVIIDGSVFNFLTLYKPRLQVHQPSCLEIYYHLCMI